MFSGKYPIAKHNDRYFYVKSNNNKGNGKVPSFRDQNEESKYYEEIDFWQIPYKEDSNCIRNIRHVHNSN